MRLRFINYFLAVITVILSVFGVNPFKGYSSEPTIITDGETVNVESLDTHIAAPCVKTRRQVDGFRLYIDRENPLFRFHPFPLGGSKGEDAVNTYRSLPEDIRAFSAVLIGNYEGRDKEERYRLIDDALTITDEANVPIIAEIEVWNSFESYEGFSQAELSSLFENHPSLVGVAHVELFCVDVSKEECERLKTSIRVAQNYGALVVWADAELRESSSEMVFSQFLEDKELYDLMKSYSHNIIITDKHNGSGRHFAVQSQVIGCWLSGVCDNWGANIESWLWWEEGLAGIGDEGAERRHYPSDYSNLYPSSLAGIDTISDLVGGATVYSSEGLNLYRVIDGSIELTEDWWSVIYPLYQQILGGAIESKDEVISRIKTCYQVTDCRAKELLGLEADLFVNLYGPTGQSIRKNEKFSCTKKWIPTTGRYYIIPIMLKYADVKSILPDADIITHSNYTLKLGLTLSAKLAYFNSLYSEEYVGSATLFSVKDKTYIFNNSENTSGKMQVAQYALSDNISLRTELQEHAYVTVDKAETGLKLKLVNTRADYRDALTNGAEWQPLLDCYAKGLLFDNPKDRRTTTFVINGLIRKPTVSVSGTATVKAVEQWSNGTYILQITSNGTAEIEVAYSR